MILVNTDYVSGKELETLGLVKGSAIQAKQLGKEMGQLFKFYVGSELKAELKAYTEMMNDARTLAIQRMVDEAARLGADGIVNVRFVSSSVMGATEALVYGTAVKFI